MVLLQHKNPIENRIKNGLFNDNDLLARAGCFHIRPPARRLVLPRRHRHLQRAKQLPSRPLWRAALRYTTLAGVRCGPPPVAVGSGVLLLTA